MNDDLLDFNVLVGRQIIEWGYTFNVDEFGLMVYDESIPDEGPLALLHHAGEGLIEVVYFQDGNTAIPQLPKSVKKKVFMGDPGWEGKVRELLLITKRAYAEGINGHQKRD